MPIPGNRAMPGPSILTHGNLAGGDYGEISGIPPWLAADDVPSGSIVVGCGRVSNDSQDQRRSINNQRAEIMSVAEARGLILKTTYCHVAPGKMSQRLSHGPWEIAVDRARKWGAFVLAPDISRIARPEAFDSEANPMAPYEETELQAIQRSARGIKGIALITPLGASASEVRGAATKRGLENRRNQRMPLGRPSTADNPKEMEQILFLRQYGDGVDSHIEQTPRGVWLMPARWIAANTGMPARRVKRALDNVPWFFVNDPRNSSKSWGDLDEPYTWWVECGGSAIIVPGMGGQKEAESPDTIACDLCDKTFQPSRRDQRFCDRKCKEKARVSRRRKCTA
jgi:hypothetical protein